MTFFCASTCLCLGGGCHVCSSSHAQGQGGSAGENYECNLLNWVAQTLHLQIVSCQLVLTQCLVLSLSTSPRAVLLAVWVCWDSYQHTFGRVAWSSHAEGQGGNAGDSSYAWTTQTETSCIALLNSVAGLAVWQTPRVYDMWYWQSLFIGPREF
jgi:hypothetical protein